MDDLVLIPMAKWMSYDLSSQSIFLHPLNGFYRPLPNILLKICVSLFGFTPAYYTVFNLALFIVICALCYVIIKRLYLLYILQASEADLARARNVAFITAVLYCVHPINAMIVNYKTASMLALYVIFMQLSLWFFLRHIQGEGLKDFVLSVLFYIGALLSHQIGSFLVLIVFFIIVSTPAKTMKKGWALLWPYLIFFVLYMLIWPHFSKREEHLAIIGQIPFKVYLATLSLLLQWYMSKLFLPVHLLFLWNVLIEGGHVFLRILWLFGLGMFVLTLFYVFKKFKKRFEVLCLAIFVFGFIPFFLAAFAYAWFPTKFTALIEPHWFYFSSMGFFALVASAGLKLTQHWNTRIKALALALLVTTMVLMTRQGNLLWKDTDTYCRYWASLNHFNEVPYTYMDKDLAYKYVDGQCQKQHSDHCRGISERIFNTQRDYDSYMRIGYQLYKYGAPQTAVALLKQCISRNPENQDPYLLAGIILIGQGEKPQGLLFLNRVHDPYAYIRLGDKFGRAGDDETAVALLKMSLQQYPHYKETYLMLGVLLANKGLYQESMGLWRQGAALDPADPRFASYIQKAQGLLQKQKPSG